VKESQKLLPTAKASAPMGKSLLFVTYAEVHIEEEEKNSHSEIVQHSSPDQ
jgi:hypothetical protein